VVEVLVLYILGGQRLKVKEDIGKTGSANGQLQGTILVSALTDWGCLYVYWVSVDVNSNMRKNC